MFPVMRLLATMPVVGILLVVTGVMMLLPAVADATSFNPDWQSFLAAALLSISLGGTLFFAFRTPQFRLHTGQGFLLTVTSWIVVASVGAFPFIIGLPHLSFTDAFFESISGLTTTGSTVISGLDHLPPGILLWRSLEQWLGGIGIIVMAIIILPFLRIGGMQLFRTEASGAETVDRPFSGPAQLAAMTAFVYFVLTALCTLSLFLAGMSWFDAVCHAMTTLSTGGFSTKDASVGFFHSAAVEAVETVFMLSGALPLVFYVQFVRSGVVVIRKDGQVVYFLAVVSICIALVWGWLVFASGVPVWHALRLASFNVTSIITDTGFATADFSLWGPFAVGLFFAFFFIGGCAGSTAGGVKVFRWRLLAVNALNQIRRALMPHRVVVARYAGAPVAPEVSDSVRNFFFLYVMTFVVLSLLLMLSGVDPLSASSGVAQAMANAGPGLGALIGPAGNFESLPDVAKWLLSAAMLLGRLELITIFVLFSRGFWRG